MATDFDRLVSSESNEWYTPDDLARASQYVLGGVIDLDPASSSEANRVIRASTYYTIEDDGMSLPWYGSVFLNPPYGRKGNGNYGASAWIERLICKFHTYTIDNAVVICRGDSKGIKLLTEQFVWCDAGRVEFTNPDKPGARKPVPGTRIYYLGDDPGKFANAFLKFGIIVKPY